MPYLKVGKESFERAAADTMVHVNNEQPWAIVKDYSAAIARSIERLGDRYLLAKPINRMRRRREPVRTCHKVLALE